MTKYYYGEKMSIEETKHFNDMNGCYGLHANGESLVEKGDDYSITYVIFEGGKFTPYGFCRKHDGILTIAKWSHYVNLDARTLEPIK